MRHSSEQRPGSDSEGNIIARKKWKKRRKARRGASEWIVNLGDLHVSRSICPPWFDSNRPIRQSAVRLSLVLRRASGGSQRTALAGSPLAGGTGSHLFRARAARPAAGQRRKRQRGREREPPSGEQRISVNNIANISYLHQVRCSHNTLRAEDGKNAPELNETELVQKCSPRRQCTRVRYVPLCALNAFCICFCCVFLHLFHSFVRSVRLLNKYRN